MKEEVKVYISCAMWIIALILGSVIQEMKIAYWLEWLLVITVFASLMTTLVLLSKISEMEKT